MSRHLNNSRQSSIMTDNASTKHLETENSIDMYPELGPNKAALLVQEEKAKANQRYGTSKDANQRKSRKQLDKTD